MLSVKQVAEQLNLSRQCVYALIESGLLPVHRFGVGRGTIRVSEADLNEYVASQRECRQKQTVRPRRSKLRHLRL